MTTNDDENRTGSRRRRALFDQPLFDFAAIVSIATAVGYAAAFLYQFSTFNRFNIPLSEMEFPTSLLIGIAVCFIALTVFMVPYILAAKPRREDPKFSLVGDSSAMVLAILGIYNALVAKTGTEYLIGAIYITAAVILKWRRRWLTLRLIRRRRQRYNAAVTKKLLSTDPAITGYREYRARIRRARRESKRLVPYAKGIISAASDGLIQLLFALTIFAGIIGLFGKASIATKRDFDEICTTRNIITVTYPDRLVLTSVVGQDNEIGNGYEVMSGKEIENVRTVRITVATHTRNAQDCVCTPPKPLSSPDAENRFRTKERDNDKNPTTASPLIDRGQPGVQ